MSTTSSRNDWISLALHHLLLSICLGVAILFTYDIIAASLTSQATIFTARNLIENLVIALLAMGLMALHATASNENARVLIKTAVFAFLASLIITPSYSIIWSIWYYHFDRLSPRIIAQFLILTPFLLASIYGWYRLIRNRLATGDWLTNPSSDAAPTLNR